MELNFKERLESLTMVYSTLGYYHGKVKSWLNKKTQSKVVEDEKSFYSPTTEEVHLNKEDGLRGYAHEFGHEFYYRTNPSIKTFELFEMAMLFGQEDDYSLVKELGLLGGKKTIRIFTDYLSLLGMRNIRELGYYSHTKEYCQKASSKTIENEVFAEFFAAIYCKDILCFEFMLKTFPDFCNSCFMAIEKGISLSS